MDDGPNLDAQDRAVKRWMANLKADSTYCRRIGDAGPMRGGLIVTLLRADILVGIVRLDREGNLA